VNIFYFWLEDIFFGQAISSPGNDSASLFLLLEASLRSSPERLTWMLRLSEVLPLSSEIMAKYYKEFYARNGEHELVSWTVGQER
jgi:hypothetical protein